MTFPSSRNVKKSHPWTFTLVPQEGPGPTVACQRATNLCPASNLFLRLRRSVVRNVTTCRTK